MRLTLQDYSRKQIEADMVKIDNVISISKGPTLEANIGGHQKLDRSCIGAAMNDALNLLEGCYDFSSDNLPRIWHWLSTDEIVKRLEEGEKVLNHD